MNQRFALVLVLFDTFDLIFYPCQKLVESLACSLVASRSFILNPIHQMIGPNNLLGKTNFRCGDTTYHSASVHSTID